MKGRRYIVISGRQENQEISKSGLGKKQSRNSKPSGETGNCILCSMDSS